MRLGKLKVMLVAAAMTAAVAVQAGESGRRECPGFGVQTQEQLDTWRANLEAKSVSAPVSSSPQATDHRPRTLFFTGKPYDADQDAYLFKYRAYDPNAARWTTSDPSGFPDGANNWVYVNNGSSYSIDILGLEIIHMVRSASVPQPRSSGGPWGHSAALVGAGSTWDYYSYGPSAVNPENGVVDHRQFNSREAALQYAQNEAGYDRYQSWDSCADQDDSARAAGSQWNNTPYAGDSHNCWNMVDDMLTQATITHDRCKLPPIPNQAYDRNTRHANHNWGVVVRPE